MTDQEILSGLAEIIEEIADVPADEVFPAWVMSSASRSRGIPSLRAIASIIRRFA